MAARLLTSSFSGISGAGNISVSGVKAGDRVLAVVDSNGADQTGRFGPIVVTDGELVSVTSGGGTYQALVEREVLLS